MIKSYSRVILLAMLVSACSINENDRELYSISGFTMGTTYSIKIAYGQGAYSESAFAGVQYSVDSILTDINMQMSTYINDSEISLFNQFQDTIWFSISRDFAYVLQRSVEIGNQSKGALDITVGPLVNLWGFGPVQKAMTVPPKETINETMKITGLNNLTVDTTAMRVKKLNSKLHCDLSSTAKGFGVDKIADYISGLNFTDYMVEIGGEVRAKGKNHNNEVWKIGIAEPNSSSQPFHVISLHNMSMATSGDYWNFFEKDGETYSHTIDPRTGYPVTHDLASVTIVSESCLDADALATAINVLGPVEGYQFAVENDLAAFFIIRDGDKFISEQTEQFESMIAQERIK